MWPIYLLGLSWTIPNQCATAYLTLVLGSLGFDTFETNLLTVPAYVLFTLQLLAWTWISERINNRFLIIFICQLYMLPLCIALETLPPGAAYAWGRYVLNMMLVGFPYVHAILGTFNPTQSARYASTSPLILAGSSDRRTYNYSGHDESQCGLRPHTYSRLGSV